MVTNNRANTHVLCDHTGVLTAYKSRKNYPAPLRRVVITDARTKKMVDLLVEANTLPGE